MRLIAHRGFSSRYPENTRLAFRRAAAHADMVEFDVRRCGSGDLVVVHDGTVDRVTDAAGRVDEFSADDLASLSVLDSREGIPTLAEVMDAIPPEVGVNLELKERGLAADALALVSDIENEVVVSSFATEVLREVERVDETVTRAYIFERRPIRGVETARALGCAFAHPHWLLCFGRGLVERAHDAGIEVNAWSVDSPLLARALEHADVDGLIAARPVCSDGGRRGGMRPGWGCRQRR